MFLPEHVKKTFPFIHRKKLSELGSNLSEIGNDYVLLQACLPAGVFLSSRKCPREDDIQFQWYCACRLIPVM